MALTVVLEVAPKRAFASALDWPGWARSGRTPDDALASLLAYAPRYAEVAELAGIAFSPPATTRGIDVLERLTGGGGTEFGVPGAASKAEADPLTTRELNRLIALLEAAWSAFDRVATGAEGTTLALGPRGGGRQVPKIVDHVRDAEAAYVHQLGWKVTPGASIADLHGWFIEAVRLRAAGTELPTPNRVKKPWGPRYAIRRSAWHALDHAWEVEDRRSR